MVKFFIFILIIPLCFSSYSGKAAAAPPPEHLFVIPLSGPGVTSARFRATFWRFNTASGESLQTKFGN